MMNPAPSPSALPRRPRNLARGVVDYWSDNIRAGKFKPGDKLPTESEIMRLLGISRTVVREALFHMQAAGMVETRHGIGTFVLPPVPTQALGIDPSTVITMRDVLSILELRISLETEAAGLAANRRTEAQLQALRMALDTLHANTKSGADTVEADMAFHLAITLASDNRYFYDILCQLGTNIIPRSRLNSAKLAQADPGAYLERMIREHEDIFNAIARQDPDSARAAMRTHLSNSRERLRQAQERVETGQG